MEKAIVFNGETEYEMVEGLLNRLQYSQSRRVILNSGGGLLDAVFMFASSLKSSNFVPIGMEVNSAAVALYALGSKRLATDSSSFGFHMPYFDNSGGIKSTYYDLVMEEEYVSHSPLLRNTPYHEGLKCRIKIIHQDVRQYCKIIMQNTRLTSRVLDFLIENNEVLSAEDAYKWGLVERIISHSEFERIRHA